MYQTGASSCGVPLCNILLVGSLHPLNPASMIGLLSTKAIVCVIYTVADGNVMDWTLNNTTPSKTIPETISFHGNVRDGRGSVNCSQRPVTEKQLLFYAEHRSVSAFERSNKHWQNSRHRLTFTKFRIQ
jgi:hypothetical protein